MPPTQPSWIRATPAGLHVAPGDFYIDPGIPVPRAVITHGHGDHARGGHGQALATPETLAIMALRYGEGASYPGGQALAYGEVVTHHGVEMALLPAGHVLGSAQIQLTYDGQRVIVSGDYKRRRDPTCAPFVPAACDLFITEATFALPVFRHPDAGGEIAKVIHSLKLFPERTHLIGAYALGKAQRVIMLLREAGYDQPIYIHGGLVEMCALYERFGVRLGPLLPATAAKPADLKGQVVVAPPGALADRWSRRMNDPVIAMASGWMRIRQRAKQQGVELPLVISDHADWDELLMTVAEIRPGAVWITHGREEALTHAVEAMGIPAKALSLTGYEDESE
jgi:putative mRNA 3-end processing factor